MNLTDAFKLFNELGVKYTEIHGGKLGGDFPDVSLSSNMAPEHIEYLKSICKNTMSHRFLMVSFTRRMRRKYARLLSSQNDGYEVYIL